MKPSTSSWLLWGGAAALGILAYQQGLLDGLLRLPGAGVKFITGQTGATQIVASQRMLQQLGYDVVADGIVGPATKRAVMEFQSLHDLEIDGLLGPATFASLAQAIGAP